MSLLRCSKDFETNLKLILAAEFPNNQISPKPCLFRISHIFPGQLSFASGNNISLYDFTLKELSLRLIILVQNFILFD